MLSCQRFLILKQVCWSARLLLSVSPLSAVCLSLIHISEHQKKMIEAFLELADAPNTQIVLTTHCANIVKKLQYKQPRNAGRLRREVDSLLPEFRDDRPLGISSIVFLYMFRSFPFLFVKRDNRIIFPPCNNRIDAVPCPFPKPFCYRTFDNSIW